MTDIEKVLREVREAAKDGMGKIARLRDCPDELQDWSIRMNTALAAFTADMPGAIGEVVAFARWQVGDPPVGITLRHGEVGQRRIVLAALAKLEVK